MMGRETAPDSGLDGAAHDRDDPLGGGRIGRVVSALVAREPSAMVAGHGRWRTATASSVEKNGIGRAAKPHAYRLHHPLLASNAQA